VRRLPLLRRPVVEEIWVPELVVEIHVPLLPATDAVPGEDAFGWIEDVEDYLDEVEERGDAEVFEDGEEIGASYVFFVTGADEPCLLDVATQVVSLAGVPQGAFAVVTDDEVEQVGAGRRVALPVG